MNITIESDNIFKKYQQTNAKLQHENFMLQEYVSVLELKINELEENQKNQKTKEKDDK